MLLKLDKQNMDLVAVCGILETYKPSRNVKQIHKKVEKLKELMEEFMELKVTPQMQEIEYLITQENEKYIERQNI